MPKEEKKKRCLQDDHELPAETKCKKVERTDTKIKGTRRQGNNVGNSIKQTRKTKGIWFV